MEAKARLIFPLDLPSPQEALRYIDLLNDHVGCFKVGLQLFVAGGLDFLKAFSCRSKADLFLDLKFNDIPDTVKGALRSCSEFHRPRFVTVFCDQGRALLEAISASVGKETSVLGVTVLTSQDEKDLLSMGYREELASNPAELVLLKARLAKEAGCSGVVCSGREAARVKEAFGADFLVITPGIRPSWSLVQKDDQKRTVSPYEAILEGADYIVVGRPIRDHADPVEAAQLVCDEIASAINERAKRRGMGG